MSIFDIFKIGIGPSSSHTTGPMVASSLFLHILEDKKILDKLESVEVELYGSLALTGAGHSTDRAICLGLMGQTPESINPDRVDELLRNLDKTSICIYKDKSFKFCPKNNIKYFKHKELPVHPNGICFIGKDENEEVIFQKNYYSIGGGFVVDDDHAPVSSEPLSKIPYKSAKDLLHVCEKENMSFSELVYKNELCFFSETQINTKLKKIWDIMNQSIEDGLNKDGLLPGSLKLKRRARKMYQKIESSDQNEAMLALCYIEVFALAVSEENASGGRIITAPTNGAAGIIPAVIKYYLEFTKGADFEGVKKILLTAGMIGQLYKRNASISGAEVGCQGEVGVASSMAAAGITEALGGTIWQVENAAEIGMEHALGLTCDPVGGYVQIPCIERNAMGAIKAIASAQMALLGDGSHTITLDKVIKTMFQTGIDMQSKYRETSLGGLAVNIPEC